MANTQPQNASQHSLPAGKRRRLLKFGVTELSLVDKGAVGQSRYVIAKRDPNAASGGDVDAIVAAVGSGGAGSVESISKAKPSELSGSGSAEVSASGVSVGESAMAFPWESDSELLAIVSMMARDRVRAALADMPKESQDEVGEHVESKQMHPALSPIVSDICGEQNNGVWALRNVDVADPRQKDALCGRVESAVVMAADDLLNWWRVKPNFVVDMANEGYAAMVADIGRKVLGAASRLDIEQWKSSGIAPKWLGEKSLDAVKFGDYSPRDFGGSNVMAQHSQAVADAVVAWANGVVMAGGLPVEKAYGGGKSCSSKVEKGGDKKPSFPAGKKAPPFGKKPGDAKTAGKKPNPFAKKPADDKASGKDGGGDDTNAKPDGKKKFPFAKAATPAPKSAEKGPDGKFAWENDENLKALLEREGARGVSEAMPDVDESDVGSVAEMAAAGSLHPKLGEMRDKIRSFQPELWSTHGIDMNDPRQVEALDRHLHAAMVAAAGGGEGGGGDGEGGANGSAVDPVIDPAAANVNTIGMTGGESAEGGGDADGGEPISDDIEDGMEAEATEGESVDGAADEGMDAATDGADGMDSDAGEGMDADASESAIDGEGEVEQDDAEGDGEGEGEPFLPAEGEDGGEGAGEMEGDETEGGDEPSEDVVNAIGAIANDVMEDVAEQVGEDRLPELANAINEANGEIPEELSQLIDDAIVAGSDDLMEVGVDVSDEDQSSSAKKMIVAALVAMMGDDGQDAVEDAIEGDGEDEGEDDAEDDGDGEDDDMEDGDDEESDDDEDDSSLPAGLGKSYCLPEPATCADTPPSSSAGLCSADQDAISRAVADAIVCLRSVAHLLDPAGLNMLASIMSWADACCRPCDELLKALNTKVPAKSLHGETKARQQESANASPSEQDELAALDRELERRELEKRQREEEAEASLLLQRLNEFATRLETHTAQMEQLETRIGRVSGGK